MSDLKYMGGNMTKIKSEEKDRFLEAMKIIVSVPKAEMEQREAEYRKMRTVRKTAKSV